MLCQIIRLGRNIWWSFNIYSIPSSFSRCNRHLKHNKYLILVFHLINLHLILELSSHWVSSNNAAIMAFHHKLTTILREYVYSLALMLTGLCCCDFSPPMERTHSVFNYDANVINNKIALVSPDYLQDKHSLISWLDPLRSYMSFLPNK